MIRVNVHTIHEMKSDKAVYVQPDLTQSTFCCFATNNFFFRFWSKHPNTNLLTFLNYFQRHLLNHLGKIISFTTKFWCFLEECFLFPQYATFSSVCSNIVVFMRYFGPYFSYFFKIIFFSPKRRSSCWPCDFGCFDWSLTLTSLVLCGP